LRGFIWTFWSV